MEQAKALFPNINITTEGHKYLGSFIGTDAGKKKFIAKQIEDWTKDIDALAEIANSEPQLAYSAYIYGTSKRWQFVCRTTPNITEEMKVLEEIIAKKLIPVVCGKSSVTSEMRSVFNLPARMGGLSFLDPSAEAEHEYINSTNATQQLTEAIFEQKSELNIDEDKQKTIISDIKKNKSLRAESLLSQIKDNVSESMYKLIELSSEKGASSWLTSLPLKEYGFCLNKQEFMDAIAMRYNFKISDVSKKCACGETYTINHCLTCKKGGYVNIRHNVVRDTTHELLTEICKDVRIEPALQSVTGEILPPGSNVKDGARSDVCALSFWTPLRRAFFDIRVFNPLAPTNWCKEIPQMYDHHEEQKKKEYNARILEIERGSFTPLVFSCTGGVSGETEKFMKRLALKISEKKQEQYSQVVSFIRRRLRFDILRSCIVSLRGERGSRGGTHIAGLDLNCIMEE